MPCSSGKRLTCQNGHGCVYLHIRIHFVHSLQSELSFDCNSLFFSSRGYRKTCSCIFVLNGDVEGLSCLFVFYYFFIFVLFIIKVSLEMFPSHPKKKKSAFFAGNICSSVGQVTFFFFFFVYAIILKFD